MAVPRIESRPTWFPTLHVYVAASLKIIEIALECSALAIVEATMALFLSMRNVRRNHDRHAVRSCA